MKVIDARRCTAEGWSGYQTALYSVWLLSRLPQRARRSVTFLKARGI